MAMGEFPERKFPVSRKDSWKLPAGQVPDSVTGNWKLETGNSYCPHGDSNPSYRREKPVS
jgi:hypothetical protein